LAFKAANLVTIQREIKRQKNKSKKNKIRKIKSKKKKSTPKIISRQSKAGAPPCLRISPAPHAHVGSSQSLEKNTLKKYIFIKKTHRRGGSQPLRLQQRAFDSRCRLQQLIGCSWRLTSGFFLL
jgi:hypothetical protein